MMSIQPKTLVRMKQLTKVESIVYLLGGITMVAGAGLYAFLLIQPIACWLMLVGAILFALMQSRQRYLGTVLAIRRLRKIMSLAGWGIYPCWHLYGRRRLSFSSPYFHWLIRWIQQLCEYLPS